MPRAQKKLAAIALHRLPAGIHGDGLGLWLQVTPAGNRSWLFRYMRDGKARAMGLGPLHTISLAAARAKAQAARVLLLDGQDPLNAKHLARNAARLEAAKALTFEDAAERYISAHEPGWRNGSKSAGQWRASLRTYAYPVMGALPVGAIETAHVMRVLEPVWPVKTETAARVRQRIESVLHWAIARGFRTGPNPATWRGHLDRLLPHKAKVAPVQHFAAMPYADVPPFIRELRRRQGLSALALQLTILTASRTNEVIGSRWPEFDAKGAVWTVPAERMKGGRIHRVATSKAVLQLLKRIPRMDGEDHLFPGSRLGRPLSNMAMVELLKGMRPGLTVHGFRSSFRDWAAAETNHPREVAESALAHALDNKVEAAYRRGDLFEKRRRLMQDWADYCAGKK